MDTQSLNAGLTGTIATAASITISMLPEVEAWLRIISLIVGICVGIGSLIVLYKNYKKNES
jgi:uncharacterized membrane protein YuzA (DUF378 family)